MNAHPFRVRADVSPHPHICAVFATLELALEFARSMAARYGETMTIRAAHPDLLAGRVVKVAVDGTTASYYNHEETT